MYCVSMCECIMNHTEVAGRRHIGVLSRRDIFFFSIEKYGGLCDVNVFMAVFHIGCLMCG